MRTQHPTCVTLTQYPLSYFILLFTHFASIDIHDGEGGTGEGKAKMGSEEEAKWGLGRGVEGEGGRE